MPRKPSSLPFGTVLTILREAQDWPQNELAAALGCAPTLVCDYEAGRKSLSRTRLDTIVAVLGLPSEAVDRTLDYLVGIRALSPPEGGTACPGDSARAVIAQVATNAEAYARSMLTLDDQRRAQEARHDARFLWERLKPLTSAQRRAAIDASQELRSWALCELVCEKSIEAAADRADRALDLASLAVYIAEKSPGVGEWRKRLQGYALAHLANARRVGGDLAAADKVFVRAKKLWEAGAVGLR
jgi:transcriptional regulator with XRE-family HTH domain